MIWIAMALGLLVTIFGASSSAALITVSRSGLAEAVSRRLRGTTEPLDWLYQAERELSAATATTGLGIVLLGGGLSAAVAPISGQLPLWGTPVLLLVVAVPWSRCHRSCSVGTSCPGGSPPTGRPEWPIWSGRSSALGPDSSAWSFPSRPAGTPPTCGRSGVKVPRAPSAPPTS